ncbi:phage tail protein [Streptomyces griseocarneus]|nr:phage tail protein [Streptomyces griseocarneus]
MPPTPLTTDATSPGSLITQDGQIQWGDILLGPGTDYEIADSGPTGWADLPVLDSGDVLRPDQHGAWPGAMWAQARTVTAPVWLLPRRPEQAAAVAREFRAATAVHSGEQWLAVRLHGETLACRARVNQRVIPHDRMFVTRGIAKATVQWICADPRRLSVGPPHSQSTGLPVVADGGLVWPAGLNWPLDWGKSGGSTGQLTVHNAGDAPTSPVIEFQGPVDRPTLTRRSDDLRLEYGIRLTESERLTIDVNAGTVVSNGTQSRVNTATAGSAPEQLFQLEPGETQLRFSCAPGAPVDPRAAVTVTWRDAHW